MTFREKIAQAAAGYLFSDRDRHGLTPDQARVTLVITKYKKDAVALLREIRDEGDMYREILGAALPGADNANPRLGNTDRNLSHRLSRAHVSIGELKATFYSGIVYFFPQSEADSAMRILSASSLIPDVIVDDGCSEEAKHLATDPPEDAAADLGSWIDSIPVV